MAHLIHNEQVKLKAAALSNIGVVLIVSGAFLPFLHADLLPSLGLGRVILLAEVLGFGAVLPRLADQNPWAQSRNPMDRMVQGWASSLFQASQQ